MTRLNKAKLVLTGPDAAREGRYEWGGVERLFPVLLLLSQGAASRQVNSTAPEALHSVEPISTRGDHLAPGLYERSQVHL
jgi:hypothetical protein